MIGFAEARICRRRVLLGYFGESPDTDCGNCDICLNPPERYDATEDARKALSSVFRVGQRFGMGHVIDVLRGSRNERVRTLGHDRLSTYGIGSSLGQDEWGSIFRQLVHLGYLEQDLARYSVLRLTEAARPLLRGEQTLTLAKHRVRPVSAKKAKKVRETGRVGQAKDDGLFQALRALRKEIAGREGVPPFVVFGDATLAEMAARRPADAEELLSVIGVGKHKQGKYGAEFLQVIAEFSAEQK